MEKITVLKFVGLAIGFLAKFVTGSIFVFNVYQDAIKQTFNYTQKEVELLSSMLNVGLGVGFLPGMFYDRFGPTLTSGAGFIVSVPILILIWSTTRHVNFYSNHAWLMSIYFLLMGLGSVFTYMVALNTNVINFSSKHTGKIVGFLNAFFAGSPSVFATVYYNIFTHGDQTNTENQNFAGFMLFFAVMYGIANILCMVFLRVYSKHDDSEKVEVKYYKETDGIILNGATTTNGKSLDVQNNVTIFGKDDEDGHMSLREIVCNLDFHSFVWMFALVSSVGLVYTNNITVASRSAGLDDHNDQLVIIIPVTNAIVSASIGILSDVFKEKVPRLVLVTGSCLLFVLAQVLLMTFADKLTVFVIATVCAGAGIGVVWSLSPTIMKEQFYVRNLGRNWGIALFFAALVAFASQECFGALYDSHLTSDGGEFCYGNDCIRGGYAVFLGVAVISLLCGLFILLRRRCCSGNEKS